MKQNDDSFDLPSEARRRRLSRAEEERLASMLEHSPEENMIYRAGLAFDRDSSAREEDDVLIARLASRAAERFGTPGPRRREKGRRSTVILVAAALAAAGTAAAATGVVYFVKADRRVDDAAPSVSAAAPAANSPRRGARPAPSAVAPAPAPVPAEETLAPAEQVEAARAPAVIAPSSERAASEPRGAAALFGEANKRRLAGDSAGAVVLYTALVDRYPGSSEANLAELSLGKLFLASSNAERALTYFRRAGASGGALGSEAVWGEAAALRALGRIEDERAALERLLAQYPSGTYAKAARKRLGTDAP